MPHGSQSSVLFKHFPVLTQTYLSAPNCYYTCHCLLHHTSSTVVNLTPTRVVYCTPTCVIHHAQPLVALHLKAPLSPWLLQTQTLEVLVTRVTCLNIGHHNSPFPRPPFSSLLFIPLPHRCHFQQGRKSQPSRGALTPSRVVHHTPSRAVHHTSSKVVHHTPNRVVHHTPTTVVHHRSSFTPLV